MGQKKVLVLVRVRCPHFRGCKSGTWGGKSVLFREVSSVQECPLEGFHCILFDIIWCVCVAASTSRARERG